MGEGFRVRAKTTVLNIDEVYIGIISVYLFMLLLITVIIVLIN